MQTLPPSSVQPLTFIPPSPRPRMLAPVLALGAWAALGAFALAESQLAGRGSRLALLISAALACGSIVPAGLHFRRSPFSSAVALALCAGWCGFVAWKLSQVL
ncbi:MAG: hypothetical protein H6718_14910 [Polyangiaceae bacterium]|nr:hypothetical protein [Myxococcales bacterium]MCB9586688.1 hypothetical protein [Polyangiaceae bacterium]MCB9606195.1 hypothetical protein [Polyangiaceae bacterium]